MENKKLRVLKIVVQETGGKGFQVFLDGDKERIGKIPDDQLSPAEFWGASLFKICGDVLDQTGALKTVRDDKENH